MDCSKTHRKALHCYEFGLFIELTHFSSALIAAFLTGMYSSWYVPDILQEILQEILYEILHKT